MPRRSKRKLVVEPEDFAVKGMELEELLASDFWSEVKKTFPNAELGHLVLSMGKDRDVTIGYEPKRGKNIRDHFIVASSPSGLAKQIIDILEKSVK